jgi:hypothetical protein
MDPIRPVPPNSGPAPTGDVRPAAGVRQEGDARFEVARGPADAGVERAAELPSIEGTDLHRIQGLIAKASRECSEPAGIMNAVVREELQSRFGSMLEGPVLDQAVERVLEDPGMRQMFQSLLAAGDRGDVR